MEYIHLGQMSNPTLSFTGDEIMSVNATVGVSMIAKEFTADSFEAQIIYDDSSKTLRNMAYATSISYVKDDSVIARYYLTSVKRTGKQRYTIYGTSFVGILDNARYYGGMFYGTAFKDIVKNIICANGYEKYEAYNCFTTVPTADQSTVKGVLLSEDGYGDATLSCTIDAQITIVGALPSTSKMIIGNLGYYSSAQTIIAYGISISDKWINSFYNQSSSSSSYERDPFRVGDVITFHYDPYNPPFTITVQHSDGTTTTRNVMPSISISTERAMLYIGGGGYSGIGGETYTGVENVQFNYYRVTGHDGTLYIDVVPLRDVETGEIYLKNAVTGYTAPIYCAEVSSDDFSPIGVPGDEEVVSTDLVQLEIFNNLEFTDEVLALRIYGWLPISSKREALYQVLFASCVNVIRDSSGKSLFTILSNDINGNISENITYNDGTCTESSDVNLIELTEHTYGAWEAAKKIFDNSDETVIDEKYIAEFNNSPIYGEVTSESGLTVLTYNCNCALVSGKGVINGSPYIHSKKILKTRLGNTTNGKTVSVTNATLVTYLTSENVLNRLKEYYKGNYSSEVGVVLSEKTDLQCGKKYEFSNFYGESDTGFLQKMSIIASKIIKATCEFLSGYTVPQFTQSYNNYVLLTGNGSWPVPASVRNSKNPRVYVVLVGGGNGGDSGYAGESGDPMEGEWRSSVIAKGGNYGNSGNPGKVLEFEIKNPPTYLTYRCGTGGAGGAFCFSHEENNAGASGTETTLTSSGTVYSTSNGSVLEKGIFNSLSGKQYAYKQNIWSDISGKGGNGGGFIIDEEDPDNVTFVPAETAYNVLNGITYTAGNQGASLYENGVLVGIGSGGGGGGIGKYNVRRDGGPAHMEDNIYYDGGYGGEGAPTAFGNQYDEPYLYVPPSVTYGCGGIGGVGGGGAGANGTVRKTPKYVHSGRRGGTGGPGGAGGDGCIIIYY